MKQSKKLIAAVLCLAMLLTYIPGSLFAIKASAAENALTTGVSIVEGYDEYVGAEWASKLDLPENITWEDPAKYVDPATPGLYVVPGKDANGESVSFVVKVRAYENLIPSNADFEATAPASWGAPWFTNWQVGSINYFDRMQVTAVDNGIYGQAAKYPAILNEKNADSGTVAYYNSSLSNIINATGAGQYLISIDAWSDAEYANINVWPQLVLDYGSTSNRVSLDGNKVPFAATSQTAFGVVDIDLTHNDVALSKALFYIKKNMTQIPYVCVDNAALVLLKQAFEVPANLLTITSVEGDLAPISLVQNYDDLAGKDWISYALPTTVNATLSDGSAVAVPLTWDVAPLGDMSKTGKYILTGKVATTDYIANGLAVKQFVNIHEYQNLVPNGDFENAANASWGAPWFPGWNINATYFDKMNVTPVANGINGQGAMYVAIPNEKNADNGTVVYSNSLSNAINAAGAGQYLVSLDAWSDAEYAKINAWPQLVLDYGSTTNRVIINGTEVPFAATSQTANTIVDIALEKDGAALSKALFYIKKNLTQIPCVCVDNAMVVLMKQAYTGEIPADITAINTEISTAYGIAQNYDDLVGENWQAALGLAETVNVTLSTGETVDVAVEWDYAPLGDLSKTGAYTLTGKPSAADYSNSQGLFVEQTILIKESANLIPSNADFETTATASWGAPWFPGWTVSANTFNRDLAEPVENGIYGQAAKFVCVAGKTTATVAYHSNKSGLLANLQAAGAGQYLISVDAWADAEYSAIKFYPRLTLNYGSTNVNMDGVQLPFTTASQTSSNIVNIDMEKDGVALSGATFNIMKFITNVGYVCVDNAKVVLLKWVVDTSACEHNYEETITTEATCTTEGVKTFTCSACGDSYTETIAALGHSYKTVVTAPTCAAEGYTTYTCAACGDKYVSDKTPATGEHTYDNDQDADCNVCGATREVGPEKADDLTFLQAPSLSFQDYIGMQVTIYSSLRDNYDEIYVEAVQMDPEKGAVTTKLNGFLYFFDMFLVFDQQILSWSMAENVTLTLYGVKDGKTFVGQSYSASVEDLALGMLESNATDGDAKLCTVLVNMLNYGATVQTTFDHNETLLPNTKLADYASFGTAGVPEMSAEVKISGNGAVVPLQDSISMQSKVELQMLFAVDVSAYTAKAVVNGAEKAVVMDTETMGAYGWTILRVAVGAAEMRETFTIALYDANGNAVSPVYEVSVEAYAKGLLGGTQNDVAVTMMRYGDAVAAFAAK